MAGSGRQTLFVLSEVYYPDEQATAFYMTGLAEGMANDFTVRVLCACPAVTARGMDVARTEVRNGVLIERCRGTTFNKNVFLLRVVNLLTGTVAIFLKALARVRKGDIVFVVTNPPSLPFIAKLCCILKGAECVMRVDDVYPEVMTATGMISANGLLSRLLGTLNNLLYKSIDRVVVLGRDMQALAEKKGRTGDGRISIISNWADTDSVRPAPRSTNPLLKELRIDDKFVITCAGNMGRAQAIESMFEAVNSLALDPRIHFLFIGSGAKRPWMERQVRDGRPANVTLIDQRSRDDQTDFLNACDVSMISLLPGITGAGVPSRLYNVMAAGKPVIAVAERNSEISLVVEEEGIGWVAPPSEGVGGILRAIGDARSNAARLKEMGNRARIAAEEKYSREKIIDKYRRMFMDMRASTFGDYPATEPL